MGYRTTTLARVRKGTYHRLKALAHGQGQDMVDLLDLAIILLERELSRLGEAQARVVFPVEEVHRRAEDTQLSFAMRRAFQVESEVRRGD